MKNVFSHIIICPPSPQKDMDKRVIVQYNDLKREEKEVRAKISQLENEVDKLEIRMAEIDTITDVVKGENGKNVTIRGYDRSYTNIKNELLAKQLLIKQRKDLLHVLEFEIVAQTTEVEEYISSINDSFMRRLISLRVLDDLTWGQVAAQMGGNNTEDSVRMAFNRFLG